jgi:hypothetical protein
MALNRPYRPRRWTIWTHQTIWMLPRMLPRACGFRPAWSRGAALPVCLEGGVGKPGGGVPSLLPAGGSVSLATGKHVLSPSCRAVADYYLVERAKGPAWDHSRGTREQAGWDEHAALPRHAPSHKPDRDAIPGFEDHHVREIHIGRAARSPGWKNRRTTTPGDRRVVGFDGHRIGNDFQRLDLAWPPQAPASARDGGPPTCPRPSPAVSSLAEHLNRERRRGGVGQRTTNTGVPIGFRE